MLLNFVKMSTQLNNTWGKKAVSLVTCSRPSGMEPPQRPRTRLRDFGPQQHEPQKNVHLATFTQGWAFLNLYVNIRTQKVWYKSETLWMWSAAQQNHKKTIIKQTSNWSVSTGRLYSIQIKM